MVGNAPGSRTHYLPRRGLTGQAGGPPRCYGARRFRASSPVRDPDPRHPGPVGLRPESGPSPCSHATEMRIAMYDMYPWNRPEETEDEAADALQTALDRRDNGGVPTR
ncbi:hypothetical protein GCM10023075_17390 [Streptosporangium album]